MSVLGTMQKLSIIMPVYNEQKTLDSMLRKVYAVRISGLSKEIIAVNDGSIDGSARILKSWKKKGIKVIHHKKNEGKGAAVRTGILKSTGNIIIIQDADLEYDPKEYRKILSPILKNNANVVYGSRLKAIQRNLKDMYLTHYLGNRALSLMTSVLYGSRITDMETGYKAMRKEVIEGMVLNSRRFDIEPEITAKILKRGYKIVEVSIAFRGRMFDEGKKITWRDGIAALWTLLRYRFTN